MKKYFIGVVVLLFAFGMAGSSTRVAASQVSEINARANYGVQCAGCKSYDYLTYIGMEQIGMI